MEEEEKETSGKVIICLKVHLLCYFLFILIYCWSERILVFGKLCLCYENILSLSWYFFKSSCHYFIFAPLLCKSFIYKI